MPALIVLLGLVSLAGFAVHGRLSASDPGSSADRLVTPFWLTVTQGDGRRARVALAHVGHETFQGTVPLAAPRATLPVALLSWSDPSRPERQVTVADVKIRLDRLLHRRSPMELAFGWLTLDEELGVAAHGGPSGPSAEGRRARWYYVLRLDRATETGAGRALRVVVKRTAEAPLAAVEGPLVIR